MKKLTLMASALAVASAGSAHAMEGSLTYLRTALDVAPVRASLVASNQPQGAAPGDLDVDGARLSLAMALPDIGITGKPALVVNLHHLNGDDKVAMASASGSFGFVPVDGSGTSSGGPGTATLVFSSDVTRFGVDALLRAGLVGNGPHAVAGYAGLTYGTLEQEHQFQGLDGAGVPQSGVTSLRDNLDTTYLGLVAGADYTLALAAGFSVLAGARVDLLNAESDLSAQQYIATTPFVRNTSDSSLVTRAEARLGVAWQQGTLRTSLVAALESMELPTVEHPLYDTAVFPSRISDQSSTSTSLTLGIGLAF